MHAGNLFDSLGPMSSDAYVRWIAAALAEASALRIHDEDLFPPRRDPELLHRATQLREAWSQWCDEARQLWGRVRRAGLNDDSVNGLPALIHEIARAQAILKWSPEESIRRLEEVEKGNFMTI